MNGLRLTDLYTSVQGEGPRVGIPTTFIRFGGCNLRCPGWPCDTPYAIEPEQWKNDPVVTPDEILDRLDGIPRTENMCITGGEPFTQPAGPLHELVGLLCFRDHTIDVFTNGTRPISVWTRRSNVVVVLDWKLQGSGEGRKFLSVREQNIRLLSDKDAIKFVVKDEQDLQEAVDVWKRCQEHTFAKWYIGAAWDKIHEVDLIDFIVCNGLPWRLNVQIHKYIFSPMERQI